MQSLSRFFLYKIFLFSVAILLLGSCASYNVFNIQTLKPAELGVPKNFSQPLVVANLYEGILNVPESMAQAALDSTAALEAVIVFTESISESPMFSQLDIPIITNYRDDVSKLILPFSWEKVSELCNQNNSDLLISLEYIKVKPVTESYPYWDGSIQAHYGYLTMTVYAYWRVYDVYSKRIVADYLFKDTLTWDKYDYVSVRIGNQLPGFFSAATYSGYMAGMDYSKKIAPSWMDEQRIYYHKGSKKMRVAAEFADKGQWLDAASNWQDVYKDPNTKPEIAAKAAFNMAVANEMAGNFEVAIDWLTKSEELFLIPELQWYKRIIEMRTKVLELM